MPDCPRAFLIDLLTTNESAACGFSLEPRLVEMLIDRHIAPAEASPPDWPRHTPTTGAAVDRR